MDKFTVILQLSKETKNRYRYEGENWKSGAVCGQLYPLKQVVADLFGVPPQQLKITIERA